MQLPTSSTSTDSSPLAGIFPAVAPSGGKPLTAGHGKHAGATFDKIVDDLAPDASPTDTTSGAPDAATVSAVLAASFLPIPAVTTAPDPASEAAGDPTSEPGVSGEHAEVPCGLELPAGASPTTGLAGDTWPVSVPGFRSETPGMRGARVAQGGRPDEQGIESDFNSVSQRKREGDGDADATPTSFPGQPNEHASARAFETPRFAGLPASALEHRQAQGLPPGIARLMAARAGTDKDTGTDISAASDANNETSSPMAGDSISMFSTPAIDSAKSSVAQSADNQVTFDVSLASDAQGQATTAPQIATTNPSQPSSPDVTSIPDPMGQVQAVVDALSNRPSDSAPVTPSPTTIETAQIPVNPASAVPVTNVITDAATQAIATSTPTAEEVSSSIESAANNGRRVHGFLKPKSDDAPRGWAFGKLGRSAIDREASARLDAGDQPEAAAAETEKAVRDASPLTTPTVPITWERNPAASAAATEENFAANRQETKTDADVRLNTAKKSFVDDEGEAVTPLRKNLGIAVAKTTPTMLARFLPAPTQHPASDYAAAAVSASKGLGELIAPAFKEVTTSQNVSNAHAAVEVVLHTAEQIAAREQKAVNLQFSVGEADLSVRVELHADEVRATFRTDSPELRAALSHEWQAVGSTTSGDRTLRISPAVITSSDQSAFNGFAGDTSSRQRNAQRGDGERAAAAISGRRGAAPASLPVTARPVLSPAASLTSRHLQTLA